MITAVKIIVAATVPVLASAAHDYNHYLDAPAIAESLKQKPYTVLDVYRREDPSFI